MVSARELREWEFFKDIKEPELAAPVSIANHSHWKEGETLFQAGSPATNLFI